MGSLPKITQGESKLDVISFIASIFSGAVAIGVCIINNAFITRKAENEREKQMLQIQATLNQAIAVIETKIDILEKKQDKHNNIIERTYVLERDVAVLKNRESVSENRLKDIENDMK